jgi:hypothetical protein
MAKPAETPRVNERVAMPISLARGRLFELAEDVLTHRADRVLLSHREYDEQLVLVRASDLAKMDADMAALRTRVGVGGAPFSLRGIGTIVGDPEDVLTETRKHQAGLWNAKLESFSDDRGDGDN